MIQFQVIIVSILLQQTVASDNREQCPFGYELIEFRLEHLENKMLQFFEKLETIVEENQLATDERMENLSANVTRILELLEDVERSDAIVNHQNRLDKVEETTAILDDTNTITTCRDAPSTGIFQLDIPTTLSSPVPVLCGVTLFHAGGWLVIQQRVDGAVDFNRNWTEYRNGFGTMTSFGEFWLGLELISQITRSGQYELLVELNDETGEYGYARYDRFEVDGEGSKYQLVELGQYSGTMGDSLVNSGGMKFTTVDSDNDNWSRNCAQHYLGGWWYNSCVFNNLNGLFKPKSNEYGLHWNGFTKSATYSRMMIRRK